MTKSLDLWASKHPPATATTFTDWHLEQFHERHALRVISCEQRGVQERTVTESLDLSLEGSSGDSHSVTDWCLEQFHERYGGEPPLKGEDHDRVP